MGKEKKLCVCVCVFFFMLSVSYKAENKKERNIPEQKGNKKRDTEV